jgi:hypothetical protein
VTRREDLLDAVGGEAAFVTARPPGSPFATLGRRVVVTGPAALAELAADHDPAVLPGLVELLLDPERAWPAAVALSALTGRESDVVEAWAGQPETWWAAVGEDAHERWAAWLEEAGDRLAWDAEAGILVETDPA